MTAEEAFDQRKREILLQIETADKSIKQSIDHHALEIVQLINKSRDFVTTSRYASFIMRDSCNVHVYSCSGRISVFANVVTNEKQKGGEWLLVSHDPIESVQQTDLLNDLCQDCSSCDDFNSDELVTFKFEPFVLHLEARNLECGKSMLTCALNAGYRNSGMIPSNNRTMVQIRHTMKLDVPIGFKCKQHNRLCLLVTVEYLDLLFKLSVEKFGENFKRMNVLTSAIEALLCPVNNNEDKEESKEERRLRKRAEGLERQRMLRVE